MAAVGGNVIVRFTYTGEEDIPRDATHVTIVNVRVVRRWTFDWHPNIVEVICHEDVEKIEEYAFDHCPRLRRVIMPGVTIVEAEAFYDCEALTDVQCGKLEIIKGWAFKNCKSLRSIDLPSTRIVKEAAFYECTALTDVKFGNKLERFRERAFRDCRSLKRITIPLKEGIITTDDVFMGCFDLTQVDLVEGALHETITALQLEEWRNDASGEIDSINQILPHLNAGGWDDDVDDLVPGEKARAIRRWIRSVLRRIIHYQAEHQRLLDEVVTTTLQRGLPRDIVMNNVLPCLALPLHTFEEVEGED